MMSEIGKFHHIGYLVKNIEKSKKIFESMGFTISGNIVIDEIRESKICFMDGNGTIVELIEPDKDSELHALLKTYGNRPYHLCYKVGNMGDAIIQMKNNGFLMFKDSQNAPAISETAKVVFLMHAQIGMIELVEEKNID